MTEFTTLQEMLLIAHAKMEPAAWDFVNGGTESEVTLRRNRHGLDRLAFRSRVLKDVARIDTSTTFLGHKLALPVMMAPVGSLALIDPAAAVSVAGACKAYGSLLIYSTFADPPLEIVRSKVDHPLILGLYVRGDQAWLDAAVDAAVAAGCLAIAVVTEAPYYSRRERDLINRFRSRGSKSTTYAATQKVLREGGSAEAVAAAEARMVTARLTWKTVERIRRRSSLPIILKGISTADDARLAVEHGASAIYISNHGGRQLDCAPGSIEVVPEWLAAGSLTIALDYDSYVTDAAIAAVDLVLTDDRGQIADARQREGKFTGVRRIDAELADLLTTGRGRRTHEEQRVLVFNLGIALEDLATGVEILNRARKKKAGTLLPA